MDGQYLNVETKREDRFLLDLRGSRLNGQVDVQLDGQVNFEMDAF